MHSVLVYHSISSPPEAMEANADISPARFEDQLRWLSRWRRVARLDETLRQAPSRRLDEKPTAHRWTSPAQRVN